MNETTATNLLLPPTVGPSEGEPAAVTLGIRGVVGANILPTFSYPAYTRLVRRKLQEILPKEFVRFVLCGNSQTRRYFWERLGVLPASLRRAGHERPIWIHANSYGEVLAAEPLVRVLRRRYPQVPVLISTTNFTADAEAVRRRFCDGAWFVPYDSPGIVARVLDQLRPHCLLVVEADLWPNLVRACTQRRIPIAVVSGRYMDVRYWFNWRLPLTEEVLNHVTLHCMQSEQDAASLKRLAPQARVCVTGNLKVDMLKELPKQPSAADEPLWHQGLRLTGGGPVWVAGSVHPGEDALVLDAFAELRQHVPGLTLVLAPRYLEHANRCEDLALRRGLPVFRRSAWSQGRCRTDETVVLLDSLGELRYGYRFGAVAFVGGSLVPPEWAAPGFECEGHNPLEPLVWGTPVVFGPRMENFSAAAQACIECGVGWQVDTREALVRRVRDLLDRADEREQFVAHSRALFGTGRSIGDQTLDAIAHVLRGPNDQV